MKDKPVGIFDKFKEGKEAVETTAELNNIVNNPIEAVTHPEKTLNTVAKTMTLADNKIIQTAVHIGGDQIIDTMHKSAGDMISFIPGAKSIVDGLAEITKDVAHSIEDIAKDPRITAALKDIGQTLQKHTGGKHESLASNTAPLSTGAAPSAAKGNGVA